MGWQGNPQDVPWDLPCPRSHRAEFPDDVRTWNCTIPSRRREEMGLILPVFPSLPLHGLHRAPQLSLPKKTSCSWNKAALGVLLKFQHGESSSGS